MKNKNMIMKVANYSAPNNKISFAILLTEISTMKKIVT